MEPGDFVSVPDYGTGRLVELLDGGRCRVRFFRQPAPSPFVDEEFASAQVRPAELKRHTRVFVPEGNTWKVGRLDSDSVIDGQYVIALPSLEGLVLGAGDFEVRWSRPLDDPFELIAARGTESPRLYANRMRILSAWHRQRALSRDCTGLYLASVSLHEHQVAAVRRAVDAETPRFLLADEVGLGKTIEAAAVLRSYLESHPNSTAVVLTPDALRAQWKSCLLHQFRMDETRAESIQVLDVNDSGTWPADADALIVDEAHGLIDLATTSPQTYSALRDLAAETELLLLLSATPVRSNEEAFLHILSLLDPDNYHLDDLEAFRSRVAMRDDLARVFVGLTEDLGDFEVDIYRDEISSLLPDDSIVDSLLRSAAAANDDERPQRIRAVREHLSSSYRLDHRLIRNRRTVAQQSGYPARGRRRGSPFVLEVVDETDAARAESLASFGAFLTAQLELERVTRPSAAAAFAEMAHQFCSLMPDLDTGLQEATSGLVEQWRRESGRQAQVGPEPNDLLQRVSESLGERFLGRNRGNVVVMDSSTAVVKSLERLLVERWGVARVRTHLADNTPRQNESALRHWRDDDHCRLLICDRSAEEGLNLQTADAVLFLDTPWSAMRVEQRIGRVDRYAPMLGAVPVEVLGLGFQPYAAAWIEFLADAAQIFDQSVSTLQHVLAEVEVEILVEVARGGPAWLSTNMERLADHLRKQLRQIQAHADLDSFDAHADRSVDRLISDDLSSRLGADLSEWYAAVGGRVDQPGLDEVKWRRKPRPQIPFGLEARLSLLLDQRMATTRDAAVASSLPILRAGHPLVDTIAQHLQGTDRGAAFLFARHVPGATTPVPAFHIDVMLSSAISAESLQHARVGGFEHWLLQLVDESLPPTVVSGWFNAQGERIPNSPMLRPYDSRKGDRQLSTRPDLADALTSPEAWADTCRKVSDRLRASALTWPESIAWQEGLTGLKSAVELHLESLRLRGGLVHAEDSASETISGISPRITVLGAGAIIFCDMRAVEGGSP